MSHPATVRFEDDEFRRLRQLAEKRGVTVSELIRTAVRTQLLREDRAEAVESLMEFIADNPLEVEEDIESLERRIERGARRDATPR